MAKKKTKKQKKEESKFKRERELNEIKQLEELIALNAPARGVSILISYSFPPLITFYLLIFRPILSQMK